MQGAKIVAISRPYDKDGLMQNMSTEEFIVYCARVSNPGNQINNETAPRLLRYLIKNGHWSPLEMVSATIELVTTRDIARQVLRHRSFSYQEFSQRYGSVQSFSDAREARMQDDKNRQNSIEIEGVSITETGLITEWQLRQSLALDEARRQYEWALEKGIAKEVARAVLPEGLTMSKLYMAGTIRSWFHYFAQRTHPSTQKEHRMLAMSALKALSPEFPNLLGSALYLQSGDYDKAISAPTEELPPQTSVPIS